MAGMHFGKVPFFSSCLVPAVARVARSVCHYYDVSLPLQLF
jgi:hypothetical protein